MYIYIKHYTLLYINIKYVNEKDVLSVTECIRIFKTLLNYVWITF